MKLISILLILSFFVFPAIAVETKVPMNRLNFSQALPSEANLTFDGGRILQANHNFIPMPDSYVYQDNGYIYATFRNGTSIDSGAISNATMSRVIRSAINDTPENGTVYIAGGTYTLTSDINCTTGTSSYLYYWTALPVTKSIHIRGAGMGKTILKMAYMQYYASRPALIMYSYCPYTESGGDGVGPGYKYFSLEGITFDGDVSMQTPYYHDGAGLFLAGSERYNGRYRNLEFENSPNHAFYLGYHGGGWEHNTVVENIYTHDNWGSSQIDNAENCVIENWVSDNDGYGMWGAVRSAVVLDGMLANSGNLFVNNLHITDGRLHIFGFYNKRDTLKLRISNLYIDGHAIGTNAAVYVNNCNNVTIDNAEVQAGATNYAVHLVNATDIYLNDVTLRGYRGVVTATGYANSVFCHGCNINTTGNCMMIFGTGSIARFGDCEFKTGSSATYLVNYQANTIGSIVGCHGSGVGLVYIGSGADVEQSGNPGMRLSAYGASSVSDGDAIAHGMGVTPTVVFVEGTLSGTDAIATSKNATHFIVDLNGGSTQTVYWKAEY